MLGDAITTTHNLAVRNGLKAFTDGGCVTSHRRGGRAASMP
ncbi:hypothetical protein HMPREF9582_00506 [Cutibacterium acnes HL060PA1]|nr:hypothetical protein HMPREF9582_00506 [Cutibacterium acnes HL060PA1]